MEINSVYRENSILNGMIKHNGLALHKGRKKLQGVDINEKIFSVFILAGIMMFSTTCFASMFDDLKNNSNYIYYGGAGTGISFFWIKLL